MAVMATSTPKPRSGPGTRTGANARSGPSQPEATRKDKLLSIRLSAADRALLDTLAARLGSRTAVVRAALAALKEKIDAG